MYYFSLHTAGGGHAGFLVMLPDDESQTPPQSGSFVVKLSDGLPSDAILTRLEPFTDPGRPLVWRAGKNGIDLFLDDAPAGRLLEDRLTLAGVPLVLNDLTGSI